MLVFRKNVPEEIYQKVIKILGDKKIPYDIIKYGTYARKYYLQKLLSASVLIYLQETESQGLALQEAWSYNVPTLVWQNKEWKYGKYSWHDEKIAAPYQTDSSGRFFKIGTFNEQLDKILHKPSCLNPRKYCIQNLSDKVSTQKYLEIINIKQ